MAMLRSAIRFAFRQPAPASRFFGNAGRRNPASSISSKRNYFTRNEFRKEDFTNWNGVEVLVSSFITCVGVFFYHHLRTSRYSSAHYEKKLTSDTGHHGQEKAEKKESSEASMSNSNLKEQV